MRTLNLAHTGAMVDDSGCAQLLGSLPYLHRLCLRGCEAITPHGVRAALSAGGRRLLDVDLRDCPRLQGAGLHGACAEAAPGL